MNIHVICHRQNFNVLQITSKFLTVNKKILNFVKNHTQQLYVQKFIATLGN